MLDKIDTLVNLAEDIRLERLRYERLRQEFIALQADLHTIKQYKAAAIYTISTENISGILIKLISRGAAGKSQTVNFPLINRPEYHTIINYKLKKYHISMPL